VINRTPADAVRAYVVAVAAIVACVAVLWRLPAITAAAAAPVLLLAVLLIARGSGTGPALVGAICAALGFSYYFLPPVGFGIEDPNDWVEFITFTASAIIVGELAARAERRQLELEEGKREIEQLYQQLGAAFERASEAEAARRSEQLKAALLDALTHNLRTPLTAIKASVTALIGGRDLSPAGGLSLEGRRDLLQVIDEESDRLNRFIEGLSAADRSDMAQPRSLRATDLDAIVRGSVARAGTVARHHHVIVMIDKDIPALQVDAAALTEALYILLDNASKYSPPGTTIRLQARVEGEEHVRISVSDEGPGIPEEMRERVFEKFFRIPGREPIDGRRTSVGLGLPIARRLIEAQAGRIWIAPPASQRGTEVVLTVPVTLEPSARAAAHEITAAAPS
jgi:two-component system sensor histidine kinase KdpD